jgi:hypothetical protein
MLMKIDARVEKINTLIKENSAKIFSGDAPEMILLETEISDFIKTLGQLPAGQVRDYANLVNIWALEVKKMSEKLSQTKTELEAEIKMANTQGKANKAYISGSSGT